MALTEQEWLKEMASLAALTSDDGMTVEEMATEMGEHPRVVRELLHRAKDEGRLQHGWRIAEGLDGRTYRKPVYTVTPKPPPASGPTASRRKGGS